MALADLRMLSQWLASHVIHTVTSQIQEAFGGGHFHNPCQMTIACTMLLRTQKINHDNFCINGCHMAPLQIPVHS
ncbi:hypothetical protein COCSUDRAFT_33268 [Coccomyxa subellipsoidea C-169]|uniref:Uncharacterized protein n=1 Tax=Coccomyxa subellipsoidea (strain C-169) TaxID=574566 RepID=I0YXP8_COCSC|nr:hypothetical protein COCSUDRAFT_33268 [Coccomyxa subellipsoidea C-169]EIE23167.1 hypothetical protein COCSUDRAFT_33268 [Coccomyxa subellipsoidea C-169]|eukprot:XP_005647711.1 hypothetical protein COCSUDRAFT_33268 [Coccomyxa subellipsoidea C-169]